MLNLSVLRDPYCYLLFGMIERWPWPSHNQHDQGGLTHIPFTVSSHK